MTAVLARRFSYGIAIYNVFIISPQRRLAQQKSIKEEL